MPEITKRSYGLAKQLFVSRKASGDSIVVGGLAEDSSRWTRVLTQRAAQMLWFNLVQYLYPEKSDMVKGMVTTAPIRGSDLPTITTHVTVEQINTGGYEIAGWIGSQSWGLRINDQDARQFWVALDIALYPAGWQGNATNRPRSE
jgi:hypothetical protein